MDLLVLADQNGVVDMTREAISRRTNVPLKIVTTAITELEKPDPRSRSNHFEGARMKRLDEHRDWGWVIVNYPYYRSLANAEAYRQVTREKVQAIRERARQPELPGSPAVPPPKAKAEAEAGNVVHVITRNYKFSKPDLSEMESYALQIEFPSTEINKFFDYYESNGWRVGRNPMKSWKSAMNNWKRNLHTYGNKNHSHNGNSISVSERTQLSKEYERVIERIRRITDGAASNAMGDKFFTPQEKSERSKLIERRKELKQILGIVA